MPNQPEEVNKIHVEQRRLLKAQVFAETITADGVDVRGELTVEVDKGLLVASIDGEYVMGIDPYHARLLAMLLDKTVDAMGAGE